MLRRKWINVVFQIRTCKNNKLNGFTVGKEIDVYDLEKGMNEIRISLNTSIFSRTFAFIDSKGITHNFNVWLIDVNTDFLRIEKKGLNPLDPDVDDDSLLDNYEVQIGTYPLNSDADEIIDYAELKYGTNPLKRDSDFDGLPDGAIDGWGLDYEKFEQGIEEWGMYGKIDWKNDWAAEPREEEDLNGNGIIEAGESNPIKNNSDLDIMLDGYERWFGLDPLVDDGGEDKDKDGLANQCEYIVGTDPGNADTDLDGLKDGKEVPTDIAGVSAVVMRTNVIEGGMKFDNYGALNAEGKYEWLWLNGREYGYDKKEVNPHAPFAGAPKINIYSENIAGIGVTPVAILKDKTTIFTNPAKTEVYVWEPWAVYKSGFYDENEIHEGICHLYSTTKSQGRVSPPLDSPNPLLEFKNHQEIYLIDPFAVDTDDDGRAPWKPYILRVKVPFW